MASYEALEPGGHAHLVGKIKDYANRTSGTGTTQIADGSVTNAKLSDGVQDALDEIAVSVDPMLKNGLRGTLPEGTLLTCNDSYAAPAHEVVVFGVSTQNGTPTPSVPVPILSVDALTLHASADGTTDYGNWPVQIPLSNNSLRSLPDGTRDTLTLSYQGPSETEGWGVFGVELVQRVGLLEVGTFTRLIAANTYGATRAEYSVPVDQRIYTYTQTLATQDKGMCNVATSFYATYNYGRVGQFEYMNGSIYIAFDGNEIDTLEKANAWLANNPTYCLLELTTPQTTDLGTVELPILPNPLTAWADGGSAQPTISVTYERDVNIARANIISALAEIATS